MTNGGKAPGKGLAVVPREKGYALPPWRVAAVDADARVAEAADNRYTVQLARIRRRQAQDERLAALTDRAVGIAGEVLRSPMTLAILGMVATHQLSQEDRYITGTHAVMLQSAILAPAFLASLAEVAKSAGDIAGVVKLLGLAAA